MSYLKVARIQHLVPPPMHPATLSTRPSSWPRFPGRACGDWHVGDIMVDFGKRWPNNWPNMANHFIVKRFHNKPRQIPISRSWKYLCNGARIECVAAWLPHHSPARLGSCRMWPWNNNANPSHHCFMQSNNASSWFGSLASLMFQGDPKRAAERSVVRSYCLFPTTNGQTPCLTALEFDADTSLLESCANAAA